MSLHTKSISAPMKRHYKMVCDNGLCMLTYCRHGRHGAYIVISVNAPESGYSKISFRRSKIPLFCVQA